MRAAFAVAALFIASFSPASFAQNAEPEAEADDAAAQAVWQAAFAAMVRGPNTVALKDQAPRSWKCWATRPTNVSSA
jgi:uncharacterized membrane-anchored protein